MGYRSREATHRGALAYQKGRSAEEQVIHHYKNAGAHVLQQRWRGKAGEIDLVLHQGGYIVFVEVKASKTHARAVQNLSDRQLRRLALAAEEYLAQTEKGQLTDIRFDAALLDVTGQIQIVENIFMNA